MYLSYNVFFQNKTIFSPQVAGNERTTSAREFVFFLLFYLCKFMFDVTDVIFFHQGMIQQHNVTMLHCEMLILIKTSNKTFHILQKIKVRHKPLTVKPNSDDLLLHNWELRTGTQMSTGNKLACPPIFLRLAHF